MPTKSSMERDEKKFVEANFTSYRQAYGRAMLCIRSDARFTGLDKTRDTIAHEAALFALGFCHRPLKLPRTVGQNDQAFQAMCEEMLCRAAEAAATKT